MLPGAQPLLSARPFAFLHNARPCPRDLMSAGKPPLTVADTMGVVASLARFRQRLKVIGKREPPRKSGKQAPRAAERRLHSVGG